MTWFVRAGVGVTVLAALALGRVVVDTWPSPGSDVDPFVRSVEVGETAVLRFADLTLSNVRSAAVVDDGLEVARTPGTWLLVDLTLVPRGQPLVVSPHVVVVDAEGREYRPDRAGYPWTEAPTGVAWAWTVAVELPPDALEGAVVRVAADGLDDRRDDVAEVDLGIDADRAAELADSRFTVEVPATGPAS